MKKLLSAFIAFCLSTVSQAQSWGHPGSTWTYEYVMNNSGVGGYVDYKISNILPISKTVSPDYTGDKDLSDHYGNFYRHKYPSVRIHANCYTELENIYHM